MNDPDSFKRDLKNAYGVHPRGKERFWSDFRRRAAVTGKREPASRRKWLAPPVGMRWALGTATIVIIAVVVYVKPLLVSAEPVVQSLEISQPFDSYFILEDSEDEGTVVWIEESEGMAIDL